MADGLVAATRSIGGSDSELIVNNIKLFYAVGLLSLDTCVLINVRV